MQENIVQDNCQSQFINSQLSKIHARFRQLRNGEIVDNLATQGITYRIAWGLESYRLKEIAEEIKALNPQPYPYTLLSETLWKEEVRESKMLATRLYPIEDFTIEKAREWSKEAKYTEIADQLCMNLLARVPFVEELVAELIESTDLTLYIALKLATRVEICSDKVLEKAEEIIKDNMPLYLKTAALWYIQSYKDND